MVLRGLEGLQTFTPLNVDESLGEPESFRGPARPQRGRSTPAYTPRAKRVGDLKDMSVTSLASQG